MKIDIHLIKNKSNKLAKKKFGSCITTFDEIYTLINKLADIKNKFEGKSINNNY